MVCVSFPIQSKMSSGKQLVKGKSGLRMIAISEDERCPFLLEEPHWTNDALVWHFSSFSHFLSGFIRRSCMCFDLHAS